MTRIIFVLLGIAIAGLCLISRSVNLDYPISYLTSDYITFYSVLREPARFSGTVLFDISRETVHSSFLLRQLVKIDVPPVAAFLAFYALQNFLLTYGVLTLAYALRPSFVFACGALFLAMVRGDGYFFSIRTTLSYLALGVVFISLGYVVQRRYLKGAASAFAVALIHPTQALVLAALSIGNPRSELLKKVALIVLPVAVLVALLTVSSLANVAGMPAGYMVAQQELIKQLNDNYYPLGDPVVWCQVLASLAIAAVVVSKKSRESGHDADRAFAGILAMAAVLYGSTIVLELPLPLPSLLHQFALHFRLMQIFGGGVLLICIALIIYDGLDRAGDTWLYLAVALLVLFMLPSVVKEPAAENRLWLMQAASLKYNLALFVLLVAAAGHWGRAALLAPIVFGAMLAYNYQSLLFIPVLAMLVLKLAALRPSDVPATLYSLRRQHIFGALTAGSMTLCLLSLDWNLRYSASFLTGVRSLRTTVVEREWNGGLLLVAPLREVELSPIYPVLLERLDTGYVVYFPGLRDRILAILELYKSQATDTYGSALWDATGWRRHVDELRRKHPGVTHVATLEKYVCEGDAGIIRLPDQRMRRVVLIPIGTAARNCDPAT